jgi:type III secretion protein HrpB1
MNASLQRKELVWALIDITNLGLANASIDDAEIVLDCARALRPGIRELDTFEAWISVKRGRWAEAIRLLGNLDPSSPQWEMHKALLAFCQFASGDRQWSMTANYVLENGKDPAAIGMARMLMNPEEEMRAEKAEAEQAEAKAGPARSESSFDHGLIPQGVFLRA